MKTWNVKLGREYYKLLVFSKSWTAIILKKLPRRCGSRMLFTVWLVRTAIGSSHEVVQTIFVIPQTLKLIPKTPHFRPQKLKLTFCILKLFCHPISLNSHGYAITFLILFIFLSIHLPSVPQLQGQWHS